MYIYLSLHLVISLSKSNNFCNSDFNVRQWFSCFRGFTKNTLSRLSSQVKVLTLMWCKMVLRICVSPNYSFEL